MKLTQASSEEPESPRDFDMYLCDNRDRINTFLLCGQDRESKSRAYPNSNIALRVCDELIVLLVLPLLLAASLYGIRTSAQ